VPKDVGQQDLNSLQPIGNRTDRIAYSRRQRLL
jgi:hypothetical protein